jgi:hypothetical protein
LARAFLFEASPRRNTGNSLSKRYGCKKSLALSHQAVLHQKINMLLWLPHPPALRAGCGRLPQRRT